MELNYRVNPEALAAIGFSGSATLGDISDGLFYSLYRSWHDANDHVTTYQQHLRQTETAGLRLNSIRRKFLLWTFSRDSRNASS